MDPVTLSLLGAGISGATGLIEGLLNRKAQRDEAKRNRLFQLQQEGARQQIGAAQALGQSQQDAFRTLMQSYQGVLG